MLSNDMEQTVKLLMEKRDYASAFVVTSLKDLEKFPDKIILPEPKEGFINTETTREMKLKLQTLTNKLAESYLK